MRVLFHVQHLLGIGHLQRAASIARTMASQGLDVTVLSGGEEVEGIDLGGAAMIALPGIRSLDITFKTLVDPAGRPVDEALKAQRRRLVLEAFEMVRPDLLLIESFPFARRMLRFELMPMLEAAHGRAAIACSIRDILVEKRDPARVAETVGLVRRFFDLVLVHGDPAIARLEDSFPAVDEIADRVAYTGYVYDPPSSPPVSPHDAPAVIVSAGGGAVGLRLLETALASRPLTRMAEAPWLLVAGPNLPTRDFDRLSRSLPRAVALERFRPDFPHLLRRCRVSVSQAGYNTVLDLLAARVRAVVVPFAPPGETEQAQRAQLLEARGLLRVVPEAALSPEHLAAAIDRADEAPPADATIGLDGAARTTELLRGLARA